MPSATLLGRKETFRSVVDSHDWEVDRSEEFAKDNILVRMHCPNCGLTRTMIISDIPESAQRAYERRLRND